jgi:hypothetical protein
MNIMSLRTTLWISLWILMMTVAFRKKFTNNVNSKRVENMKEEHEKEAMDVVKSETKRALSMSPACKFHHRRGVGLEGSQIRRIVFVHMRKAGGTTFWSYLKNVAKTYKLVLQTYEGLRPPLSDTMDNSTLFITHIREPSSRVLSHYKYEMRWSCKDLTNQASGFVPSRNNTRMSLRQFLKMPNVPMKVGTLRGNLWECSHNCYAKWSTGLCWEDEGPYNESNFCWNPRHDPDYDTLLSQARKAMYSYNLIFVLEWLKDPHYVQSMETIFGLSGLGQKRTDMYCGAESAAANRRVPLILKKDDIHRKIAHYNQLDRILFEDLTQCDKYQFPNRSLLTVNHHGTAKILTYH